MTFNTSRQAYFYLRKIMTSEVEELWAVALRSDSTVLRSTCLFRGTVDSCFAHPRDIFRLACLENAASLLLAHNHPSGNALPSLADIRFTRKIIRASQIMSIPILDHIILGRDSYWSFTDKRLYSAKDFTLDSL
jgi:DNA repair protein RadC